MGKRVKWSKAARDDLREIRAYIKQDSAFYAESVVAELLKRGSELDNFPNRGRPLLIKPDYEIRVLVVGSYLLIYRIQNESVEIAAVEHYRRDYKYL